MTSNQVIKYLNELLELDRGGISELFEATAVSNEIGDKTLAMCQKVGVVDFIGPLGIINGIMALNNQEIIESVYEGDIIQEFRIHKQSVNIAEKDA